MRKTSVWLAALCMAVLLVASACSKKTATTTASGSPGVVPGGILRIAGDHVDSLNPFRATEQDSFNIFGAIYPSLMLMDPKTRDFVGDFATSWDISPDGKVWTFKTQPNAKWSDGSPMTADDAAFTLTMCMKPGSGQGGVVAHMTKAEATDDTTLVVTYRRAVGNVPSQLAQISVLPRLVWEPYFKKGVKALRDYQNTDMPIVGGGPFVLSDYREDEFAKFDLNPNWYGTKPIIDGFGMRFYQNSEAQVAALQNGEVDMIEYLSPNGVDPLKSAGIPVVITPGVEFHDVIFNSNPNNPNNPELRDPQLRTALEYATDRQRMIDVAVDGFASPGSSIVPPATGKWFDPNLPVISFDLDKANQILDDAGYKMGSDGVRVAPNGNRLSYTVLADKSQDGVNRVFEILQDNWGKIGVEVKFKPMSYNQLWEANQAPIDPKTGVGEYTQFQIIIWDWIPVTDPDFILSVLQCNQYSIWSDTGYCDKSYDQMYDEQGTTVDTKARRDIVWQMQEKLYAEKPYLVLYYLDSLFAHTDKWDGFVPSFQGPLAYRDTLLEVHKVA